MKTSVIVIGGGITGISTAENLRREGFKVTLIDKAEPGDEKQTSYGNAGLLAISSIIPISSPNLWKKIPKYLFSSDSPVSIKWSYFPKLLKWLIPFMKNCSKEKFLSIVSSLNELTHDSLQQHSRLSKGTGADKFIKTGPVNILFKSKDDFCALKNEFNLRKEYGFDFNQLDRGKILKNDPHISSNYNFAASFPNHGWLTSPSKYIKALKEHFVKNGGKFLKDEVLNVKDDYVATKKNGHLKTNKIVVCTGVWSGKLLKKIDHFVNIESEKGYHIVLKGVNHMPPSPYMINDLKLAVTPMENGLRFAGRVEFSGIDSPESKKQFNIIRSGIKKIYPSLKWEEEDIWSGQRPSTSDSLPVLGNSKQNKNLFFAFGGQHVGITIGPKIGKITSDLIVGRKPNISLSEFSHDRF